MSPLLVFIVLGFLPLTAAMIGAVVRAARPDPGRTRGTALQVVVTAVLVAGGELLVVPIESAIVHAAVLIPPLAGALIAQPQGWERAVKGAMVGSLVAALGLLAFCLLLLMNFWNAMG